MTAEINGTKEEYDCTKVIDPISIRSGTFGTREWNDRVEAEARMRLVEEFHLTGKILNPSNRN